MRAHYLQHVPWEGLGSIEAWLQNAGYEIASTHLFNSGVLPEIKAIDLLIVMGGPMSANDEARYPWLLEEKDFIRSMIKARKPVLGICLGAQLIASAMGADVYPNSVREIGWFPIEAVISESNSVFQFPEEAEVFHWHGDTFNLPRAAVLLAKSRGCENQAFQMGTNVIGLQCHLETTSISAQAMVDNGRDELVGGEYIQSAADILSVPQEHYSAMNCLMGRILEHLHASNS